MSTKSIYLLTTEVFAKQKITEVLLALLTSRISALQLQLIEMSIVGESQECLILESGMMVTLT